jgi:hypothetical protein
MNERIRALYEQARLQAKSIDSDLDPQGWMDLYHRKFAELIVRECMEQVWYTREDSINGNVSEVIKDRIKEHFGVEE